jgi:hypothetical protein
MNHLNQPSNNNQPEIDQAANDEKLVQDLKELKSEVSREVIDKTIKLNSTKYKRE